MNKLPIKQIYLLVVIIVGIFALSVYSTYSIFTFEGETSDVITIHTPNSLNLSEEVYEYKQISVPKNSYIETDIDIYNPLDEEICYGIWYKAVNMDSFDQSVSVYEHTSSPSTTTVISGKTNLRVPLIVVNDNDEDINVKIGLTTTKKENSCVLNISDDKKLITSSLSDITKISDYLIKNVNNNKNEEKDGYLVYKNISDNMELSSNDKFFISDKFSYDNEEFTLINPINLELSEIEKYQSSDTTSYYTCLYSNKCNKLYKINRTETIEYETKNDKLEIIKEYKYNLINYDLLVGYLKGVSGIKKVDNNYIYYGDNPDNFIYYNCLNKELVNSCEIWRIIGVFYNKDTNEYLTKIIRNDYLDNLVYNDNIINTWDSSNIYKLFNDSNKFLNRFLINKFNNYHQEYINNILDSEFLVSKNGIKTDIMLMELSDYIDASLCNKNQIFENDESCLKSNWLNKFSDTFEWTMTYKYNELNDRIYSVGNNISEELVTNSNYVRPVVYLKNRVFYSSGNGSLDEPYVIK